MAHNKPLALVISILIFVSLACSQLTPKSAKPTTTGSTPDTAPPAEQTPEAKPTPTWQPSLTKIKSQQMAPSPDAQTLQSDNGLAVTIPGGLLNKAQEVTISSVKGDIPKGFSAFETLAMFDVTVGDQQQFSQPLTIEYKFDPSALDPSRPAADQIFAQVWDASSQTWTLLDVSVDSARGVAILHTDHLCPVSFNRLLSGEVWTETAHFYYYYWPEDVSIYAGAYKRKSTGACTHPDFVCDVADILETVYTAYGKLNYSLPTKKIYVFIRQIDDSETNPISEAVRVTLLAWRSYDVLRSTLAHELFHVSQLTTLGISTVKARKWWMEATADYVADRVAFAPDRTNQMGVDIKPRYLSGSLDSTQQFHDYSTAHFIDYLINVENVSEWDFLWSSSVQYKTSNNILLFLDEFLKKRTEKGIDEHYMNFALFYLWDPASPIRKEKTNIDAVAVQKISYDGNPAAQTIDNAMGKYTAYLYRLDTDVDRFLKVSLSSVEDVDRMLIYRFYTDDPLTQDSPPTPLFDITNKSNPPVLHVTADTPLYILVFNPTIADRGYVGFNVETSDIETYMLSLKYDDSQSDCAQQAISGISSLFFYVDKKKNTVKVTYHSNGDDYWWSEHAEHTADVDGSGRLLNSLEMDGNFSGLDTENNVNGTMKIEATFNFTATEDAPTHWKGAVKGTVSINIPKTDTNPGMECTAGLGAEDQFLFPTDKQP